MSPSEKVLYESMVKAQERAAVAQERAADALEALLAWMQSPPEEPPQPTPLEKFKPVSPPKARPSPPAGFGKNHGHGHVWARPDGVRARCGGPGLCSECSKDKIAVDQWLAATRSAR